LGHDPFRKSASTFRDRGPERNRFNLKRLGSSILVEHDLFGKPASTFPDHAVGRPAMRFEYFQMIDRIAALDTAERTVRSVCSVPMESTIFEGHFPGYALMPGVLQIECMAQTCGWLVIATNRFAAMPFLIAVKEAKFRSPVLPGEELEFEGKIIHEGSGFTVGEAKGRRQGRMICEAQITYRLLPIPNAQFRKAMLEWAERIDVPGRELFGEAARESSTESSKEHGT
jgi:3-hydroxyacyl-[acyl-carrier-protein] dehydratase